METIILGSNQSRTRYHSCTLGDCFNGLNGGREKHHQAFVRIEPLEFKLCGIQGLREL